MTDNEMNIDNSECEMEKEWKAETEARNKQLPAIVELYRKEGNWDSLFSVMGRSWTKPLLELYYKEIPDNEKYSLIRGC